MTDNTFCSYLPPTRSAMHTKSTATGRRGYLDGRAMARTAITKARTTKIRNTLITGRIVRHNQGGWMETDEAREMGHYWVRTKYGYEIVFWDGRIPEFIGEVFGMRDNTNRIIEWGLRIYPPYHKETELAD